MEKIIKIGKENIDEKESYFESIDFTNPFEVAEGFGTWLNLYFEVWAANHDTWIDSNNHAYTTEELLKEFSNEYCFKK